MSSEDFDECEIFINEVKIRPQIWDKDNSDFNNRQVNETKWMELSSKFGVPVENIKKKWAMLRIQFRRELRKQISHRISDVESNFPTIQPWKYFIPMLFMKEKVNFIKPISAVTDKSLKIDWEDKNADFNQILDELRGLENTYQQPLYEEIPSGPAFVKTSKPSSSLNIDGISQSNLPNNATEKPSLPLSSLLESFQKEVISLEREKLEKSNILSNDDDLSFLHSILPYFKALNPKQKFILRTKIQELVCEFITGDGPMVDHSYATFKLP